MSVKASEQLRKLKNTSFKGSRNVYWATAREADDMLWLVVLGPTHEAVKEFKARVDRGTIPPDAPWVTCVADVIDHWLGLFDRGAHAAEQRGDKQRAGVAHPMALSDALTGVWTYTRGALACPRQASPARPLTCTCISCSHLTTLPSLASPPRHLLRYRRVQDFHAAWRLRPDRL